MKKKRKKTSVVFEIEFYEKLLVQKEDFVDALIPLAEAYTKAGEYHKGLAVDKKLSVLKSDDPVVHYNLACSYSLVGEVDLALQTLQQAIALGYKDFGYMNQDPDLSLVRKDQRYKKLMINLLKKD